MAEMLTYAPDLRAITGGQGDYTMELRALRGGARAPGAEGHQRGPQRRGGGRTPDGSRIRLGSESSRDAQVDLHERPCRRLRRVRPHAAARRAGRRLPRRRRAAQRLRAVHAARVARGLDPRGPRRRDRALARAQRPLALVPGAPAPAPRRRRRRCTSELAESRARPPRRSVAAPSRCPQQPRSVHAVPTNADLKMARALDLFNASAHPRTVAGVARSLGAPIVAARPSADRGQRRHDRRRLGAELVPLRGRPRRRGRRPAHHRPGHRARRARRRRPGPQRRRRRPRRVAPRRAARVESGARSRGG